MNPDGAIRVVDEYAKSWEIIASSISVSKYHHRGWWLLKRLYAYSLEFENELGAGVADVFSSNLRIDRIEFYPKDQRGFMLPLWAAYPQTNSVTSMWRQGPGEVYKYRWHAWYRDLGHDRQREYQRRFPPPPDEDLCWTDFYELIADVPADPGSVGECIIGRVP